MKLIYLILILYIVIVGSVTATKIIYDITSIYSIEEHPVEATISDRPKYVGIDVSKDVLRFPSVAVGYQSARRFFGIKANHDSIVVFEVTGPLKEYASFSNNTIFMKAGEEKEFWLAITPPLDAPLGTFKGKLRAIFYKP